MSAQLIKELRDRTNAGFLDCKKALEEANNDIEKAIELLQEKGAAKAAKKAGAIAAEGITNIVTGSNKVVIYELNSQTDFVIQNELFQELNKKIENALAANSFSSTEEAKAIQVDGKTIEQLTTDATATIGEKIELRRAQEVPLKDGEVAGNYVHVNKQVSAIVINKGGSEEVARNVAMHVASMNPEYLNEAAVPAATVEEMRKEIAESDALKGKPENIVENIAKGMLRKKLSEMTLVDQEFVMEKMPVSKYLSQNGAEIVSMIRYEVGEGIEKKEEDFAAEVAAQMTV